MQIKFFFALIFLGVFNTLLANPFPKDACNLEILAAHTCQLPAPTNFHVVESSSMALTLAWDGPVTPLAHQLKIYRSSDGLLLNTTTAPAGQDTVEILGLPAGTTTDTEARAIDTNGELGDAAWIIQTPGIILDLVVKGFADLGGNTTCIINTNNSSCSFHPSGTTFLMKPKIGYPNLPFRKFYIWNELNTYYLVKDPTGSPALTFICSSNAQDMCSGTTSILIKGFQPNTIGIVTLATLAVTETDNRLFCSQISPYYQIEALSNHSFRGIPPESSNERNGFLSESRLFAEAYPNPFSESLEVFLASSAENIHLQLYNLAGQKVLDQLFAGGQDQYPLSTASLSPGFYMLRIEADGEVQTLKVVKSE